MEIKQDYAPPALEKPKKTFFSVILDILGIILIPFRFARNKLDLVRQDNSKIARFKAWRRIENGRYRRGIKINDEF